MLNYRDEHHAECDSDQDGRLIGWISKEGGKWVASARAFDTPADADAWLQVAHHIRQRMGL